MIRPLHDSLLAQCSQKRTEHYGVIHYIQGKMPDFTLKAAIKQVLDKTPSIWPLNLSELADDGGWEPTKEMGDEFFRLNRGLIMPVYLDDIIQIIELAKEFLNDSL